MKLSLLTGLLAATLLAGCASSDRPPPSAPPGPVTPTPTPLTPTPDPANPRPGLTPTARWSDPGLWPGGAPPAEGAAVTLPAGQRVLLDVNPPALASLTLPAGTALILGDRPTELRADWIMIHGGHLQIGSEAQPLTAQVRITLTDRTPGEDVMGMGDRVIAVMAGGTLDVHGQPRLPWTRLSRTARAGSDTLTLDRAPDWQRGDVLALASTDYDHRQAENVVVRDVSGTTVTLAQPLKYSHYGEVQTIAGRTLDGRAEVGLLSRNVVVRGDAETTTSGLGGQIMVMDGASARISGAELTRMGQKGVSRRYPVHFHMLGDAPTSYVRGSSLHDLFNRCVTIHGTNRVTVADNVASGTIGHCFFLEDGAETGNVLSGNLGLGTRRPDTGAGERPVLPTDDRPATFWITNPANTVRGNVAAGGDGFGFWYALPERPTGLSSGAAIWPRRTPLGEFSGNTAHSNADTGLNVDGGPDATTLAAETTYYRPVSDPADEKSPLVRAEFRTFTAYKNRVRGVWLRGEGHDVTGAVLADHAIGATFASHDSHLKDSLVVGESANRGGAGPAWETKGPDGRSLPLWWEPDFPIRGFEFYDGLVSVQNTTLANFTSNTARRAGALGYLRRNHFPLDPGNFARGLSFENANRVHLEDPAEGFDGDFAATFLDADGTVTGTAGRSVVAGSPHLHDAGCARQADWNAFVCGGEYGRLWTQDVRGEGNAPLTLTRDGGAGVTLTGRSDNRTYLSTSVALGRTHTLNFARTAPHLRIGLSDRRAGDVLHLRLPYASEPVIYRDWWIDERNRLRRVPAADLPTTNGDAYAWEGGVLHLRLVVREGRDWAELEVCAAALCK